MHSRNSGNTEVNEMSETTSKEQYLIEGFYTISSLLSYLKKKVTKVTRFFTWNCIVNDDKKWYIQPEACKHCGYVDCIRGNLKGILFTLDVSVDSRNKTYFIPNNGFLVRAGWSSYLIDKKGNTVKFFDSLLFCGILPDNNLLGWDYYSTTFSVVDVKGNVIFSIANIKSAYAMYFDINNDNNIEILLSDFYNKYRILDTEGNVLVEIGIPNSVFSSVSDIDSDGRAEIAIAQWDSYNNMYIIDDDFSILATISINGGGQTSTISADGTKIFYGAYNPGGFNVLTLEGLLWSSYEGTATAILMPSTVINNKEVCLYNTNTLNYSTVDGELIWSYGEAPRYGQVMFADINNDGKYEILFGIGSWIFNTNSFYILDLDGNTIIKYNTGDYTRLGGIFDLNNDGKIEVVVVNRSGKIIVWG